MWASSCLRVWDKRRVNIPLHQKKMPYIFAIHVSWTIAFQLKEQALIEMSKDGVFTPISEATPQFSPMVIVPKIDKTKLEFVQILPN